MDTTSPTEFDSLRHRLRKFLQVCTDEALVELGKVAFGYKEVRPAKHIIRKKRIIQRELGGEGG